MGSYENSNWASQYVPEAGKQGAFLSTAGIRPLGNEFNEFGGISRSNQLTIRHPDLPVVQFVGNISGDEPGTITEFYLLGSGSESGTYHSSLPSLRTPSNQAMRFCAALFKNWGHFLVENALTGQAFRATQRNRTGTCPGPNGCAGQILPNNRTAGIVSGAKVNNDSVGGMVRHSSFQLSYVCF